MLAEHKLGYRTPIQYCWVLDTDPGIAVIEDFAEQLSKGLLHRVVARGATPLPRRRWVRSPLAPRVTVGARIADDAVGDWADEVLRTADLRPLQGLGWRLVTTTTTSGRRVVALLISHLVSDGEAIMRGLIAASEGQTYSLPNAATARGARAVKEDVRDAAAQLRAAGRSVRSALSELRKGRQAAAPTAKATATQKRPDGLHYDPHETALAIVDVDREVWREQAAAHGGTANTLFMGVLCGVARRAGHPVTDDIKVSVAVSKRGGPEDIRANASGGVWLRVGQQQPTPGDLGELRSLSKQAFADYAKTGTEVPDDMLALVRLLPRRGLSAAMRAVPAPDVSVSNLGVLSEKVRNIFGVPASSFVLRLLIQSSDPQATDTMPGPKVSAWIVEYGDRVTLSFAAFAPEIYGTTEEFRQLLSDELTAWGIEHKQW